MSCLIALYNDMSGDSRSNGRHQVGLSSWTADMRQKAPDHKLAHSQTDVVTELFLLSLSYCPESGKLVLQVTM